MSGRRRRSGRKRDFALMLGALIVAVLIVGFFVFGGSLGEAEKDANIQTERPVEERGAIPGR